MADFTDLGEIADRPRHGVVRGGSRSLGGGVTVKKRRKKRKIKVRIVRVAPRHDLITFHETPQGNRDSGIQFDPLASYVRISGPPQGIAGKWPKHKGGGILPGDKK